MRIKLPTLIVAIKGDRCRREDDNLCNLVHLVCRSLKYHKRQVKLVKKTKKAWEIHSVDCLAILFKIE